MTLSEKWLRLGIIKSFFCIICMNYIKLIHNSEVFICLHVPYNEQTSINMVLVVHAKNCWVNFILIHVSPL
jgi:hypothetical protein